MPKLSAGQNIANFALFQAGWFACVVSSAQGYPVLGVVFVAIWTVAFSVTQQSRPLSCISILIVAAVVGYAADSVLVLAGVFAFPRPAQLGGPSPMWMVAMWVNFAATLTSSLGWLQDRYVLGSVLGAVGGPLTYYGGARFGGMTLAEPVAWSLLAVGVEWAICMPLLLLIVGLRPESR